MSILWRILRTFVELVEHLLAPVGEDLLGTVAGEAKLDETRAVFLLHEIDAVVIVEGGFADEYVSRETIVSKGL
jgi:hypothetical protein